VRVLRVHRIVSNELLDSSSPILVRHRRFRLQLLLCSAQFARFPQRMGRILCNLFLTCHWLGSIFYGIGILPDQVWFRQGCFTQAFLAQQCPFDSPGAGQSMDGPCLACRVSPGPRGRHHAVCGTLTRHSFSARATTPFDSVANPLMSLVAINRTLRTTRWLL
jgi:hypothetical protein